MAEIISIKCSRCGGTGRLDDYYDGEKQEWIQKWCPDCSGSGTQNRYRYDDGTYSDPW